LLTDDFLREVVPGAFQHPELLPRTIITCRGSVLPSDVIRDGKNKDLLEARSLAQCSPTHLAVTAVEQALLRAQITKEQVGLIVADTATPFQTCPSEAQRIGGALGLKVPAYDVVGGVGAFSLFFNLLSSWSEHRVPDYCVWVSTNTPTLHVDYAAARGVEPLIYGDGAVAVVVSTRMSGKLSVARSSLHARPSDSPTSTIDRYISYHPGRVPGSHLVVDEVRAAIHVARSASAPQGRLFIAGPQLALRDVEEAVRLSEGADVGILDSSSRHGFTLGSAAMLAVADGWDQYRAGDSIIIAQVGDGFSGACELVVSE
jgi:3-oxoacyl-[acyl-carrier-protein] synthase III